MKKILALVIAVLCLSSVSVFATAPVRTAVVEDNTATEPFSEAGNVTVDEDYNNLYYNGKRFVTFNMDNVIVSGFDELKCSIELTEKQKQNVEFITFEISFQKNIITADYKLKNGSKLFVSYLNEDYIEQYNDIMFNNWTLAEIDFNWPEDNKVDTEKDKLFTKPEILFINKMDSWDFFEVSAISADKKLAVKIGQILVKEDEYYYLDFKESGITNPEKFYIYDYDKVLANKITDKELCGQIKTAIDKNYGDDYGFFDNDKFTTMVSDILIVIVFCIVPLAIFGIFLISAIRSKTNYKKFYRIIYISALLSILIFIALVIIL